MLSLRGPVTSPCQAATAPPVVRLCRLPPIRRRAYGRVASYPDARAVADRTGMLLSPHNGSVGFVCYRGPLVPRQSFSLALCCDGSADCTSLADEYWQLDERGRIIGDCPYSLVAAAGAVSAAGWAALLLTALCAAWWVRHRRHPSLRWSGWVFVTPLLGGCALGSSATLLLGSGGAHGVGLVDYRQCAVPLLLYVAFTLVLGSLVVKCVRTVRLAGQPLQVQMAALSPRSMVPVAAVASLQAVASVLASVLDPWRARYDDDDQVGVRCACEEDVTAIILFGVHAVGASESVRAQWTQRRVLTISWSACSFGRVTTGWCMDRRATRPNCLSEAPFL
jgi:hypothetical protein